MAVFNGVMRDEEKGYYKYIVYDEYLNDIKRYTYENCYVLDVLDKMTKKYSNSEKLLDTIRHDIETILTSDIVDAEELIEIRGMNKILYSIHNIVKNKN